MRVLREHPRPSSWRLLRVTRPDGGVEFRTGPQREADLRREAARGGAAVDLVPNVVVEASLRVASHAGRPVAGPSGFVLEERGGQRLDASVRGVAEILGALADGRLRAGDGWITGLSTFAKGGKVVNLEVYDGPEAGGAPGEAGGAPDLSEFVLGLVR